MALIHLHMIVGYDIVLLEILRNTLVYKSGDSPTLSSLL